MEKDDSDPWKSSERGFGSSSGQFDPKEDNPWDTTDGEFSDTGGQQFPTEKLPVITKQMLDKKGIALYECSMSSTFMFSVASAAIGGFMLSRRVPLVIARRLPVRSIFNVLVGGFVVGMTGDFLYGYNVGCVNLRDDFLKSVSEYNKQKNKPNSSGEK